MPPPRNQTERMKDDVQMAALHGLFQYAPKGSGKHELKADDTAKARLRAEMTPDEDGLKVGGQVSVVLYGTGPYGVGVRYATIDGTTGLNYRQSKLWVRALVACRELGVGWGVG
jgi:hypothetical protein